MEEMSSARSNLSASNLTSGLAHLFISGCRPSDILYIGLNDRDPRWHDLYELHLSTGEKRLVRKKTEKIAG
jgi:hypothetical protein